MIEPAIDEMQALAGEAILPRADHRVAEIFQLRIHDHLDAKGRPRGRGGHVVENAQKLCFSATSKPAAPAILWPHPRDVLTDPKHSDMAAAPRTRPHVCLPAPPSSPLTFPSRDRMRANRISCSHR